MNTEELQVLITFNISELWDALKPAATLAKKREIARNNAFSC